GVLMNNQKFLERWRSYGTAKQLAMLLAALVKSSPEGQLTLRMSDLDDVSSERSVVYREDGDKIHLLYSAEYTTLFTIEDSVHERSPAAWPSAIASPDQNQHPSQRGYDNFSSSASIKSDEQLAELEQRATREGRLRTQARNLRAVPIASSRSGKSQH